MRVKLDLGAKKPTRAHVTDAGLDLYAMNGGCVKAKQTATFRTGTYVELPKGTAGVLLPKSGLMTKHNIITFGVVDESYRGQIRVHMFNMGGDDYTVLPGDKISQMLVIPVLYEPVELVEELSDGERGDSGFGSSGR